MKAPAFKYHDPTTVPEALDLLARFPDARPLAGGQSLMPMMNFRVVSPSDLIDLNTIDALSGIEIGSGKARFGAMTRQRDLEFSAEVSRSFPIVREALRHVGHRQTRNRGTFGGSLCHLDPSAELVNIVRLHDGTMHAASKTGTRSIAARDWIMDAMTSALRQDELLTGIDLPIWPEGHGYAYEEFARRHGDFAIAGVGCLIALASDGRITQAALCISGVTSVPARLDAAERMLAGALPAKQLILAASAEARKLDAASDAFVSAAYLKRLAGVLTERALTRALQKVGAVL